MSKELSEVAVNMYEVLVKIFANLYEWPNEIYGTELVLVKDFKYLSHWVNRDFGE